MVEKSGFCSFRPPELTPEEATRKLSLKIEGYPEEIFEYIEIEDIVHNKYFITTYGRVFTSHGKELFPEDYTPPEQNNTYLRIELSCSGYIKRRKFFVHRLVAETFIPKTQDDIIFNRNLVNHKFNKNGKCNFVWNLEWVNDSENTLHGLYFNEKYDYRLFDYDIIYSRKNELISYYQFGESNPKSRISEHQAHLICYAYTVLGYSLRDCAIYAWLEGNEKDVILVSSIVYGYTWPKVGIQYGIIPKPKRENIKRAVPIRIEEKENYEKMRKEKRR